jgi:hypothetical protein
MADVYTENAIMVGWLVLQIGNDAGRYLFLLVR